MSGVAEQVVRLAAPNSQPRFEAGLAGLRAFAPVVPVELPGGPRAWVITRYAEGRQVLADPRFVKDLRRLAQSDHGLAGTRYAEDVFAVEGRHMLNTDGVDHVRLRGVVAPQLSANAVARWRPEIERIADTLAAQVARADRVDLMSAYARPLPELVLGRVLGVPDDAALRASRLARKLGERADPASPSMRRAYGDLVDLTTDWIRQSPPGDATVLGALRAALAGRIITRREMVSTIMMLLGAGISSTAIAIGHGAATVMQASELLRPWLDSAADARAFVAELIRQHPPFPFSPWRFARESVEVAGTRIPAGATVFVLLATVNRDPDLAGDLDQFRPDRTPPVAHLTFGQGPHYCVGAQLARAEIEIALRALFRHAPHLGLAVPYAEVSWQGLLFDRTITELPTRTSRPDRCQP